MTIERKYQVFVSSTYSDLIPEREKVQQALLESDCIPIGMETFPPSTETQWEYIKRTIRGCDYYILIIAGRYGSINPATGLSYTEQEYRFAAEIGLPIITFFYRDPSDLQETFIELEPKARKRLEAFRSLALSQRLARSYGDPNELYGWVTHGIQQLKRLHPEGGWVPAKYLPLRDVQDELDSLRNEVAALRQQLDEAKAGKGTIQAIDSMPNHIATRTSMDAYIRESLRTSDSITIRVMAVSLHYSWDFLKNDLPIILSDVPQHKKISLELEMVEPAHLGAFGLDDWKEKGLRVEEAIKAVVRNEWAALVSSRRLELYLYQYRNIPHWHGTLLNNQYLFLGRTRWLIQPERLIHRLTVGEETYRLFSSTDPFGGSDRIAMFNWWFDFYKLTGANVMSEYCRE